MYALTEQRQFIKISAVLTEIEEKCCKIENVNILQESEDEMSHIWSQWNNKNIQSSSKRAVILLLKLVVGRGIRAFSLLHLELAENFIECRIPWSSEELIAYLDLISLWLAQQVFL